jgi:hypothetical protein
MRSDPNKWKGKTGLCNASKRGEQRRGNEIGDIREN